MKENDTLKNVFQALFEYTRKFTSFDYRIKSPVTFIERNENNTVEELDITESSTLVVEVSKSSGWFFKLEGEPEEDQCEFCRNYKILKFECKCKKVTIIHNYLKLRKTKTRLNIAQIFAN